MHNIELSVTKTPCLEFCDDLTNDGKHRYAPVVELLLITASVAYHITLRPVAGVCEMVKTFAWWNDRGIVSLMYLMHMAWPTLSI